MTTLYDPPVTMQYEKHDYITNTERDDDESDVEQQAFEMADYDLDVVDDALLNPNSSEYLDHFGFRIQVKTDDESSSDDDSVISEHKLEPNSRKKQRSSSLSSVDSSIFVKTARPSSVTSINSPIPRPSQSYQQRHHGRYSEEAYTFIGMPKSSTVNNQQFDKLASTFKRFSHNDHHFESEKHIKLKQKTLYELQLQKEKGGIQNNSINWGNRLFYKKFSWILKKAVYYRFLEHSHSRLQ